MSYCDVEQPAFYSATEHVARKQHACCECTAPIAIGERYLACTGKWDGDVSTFRQHIACAEACEHIRDKIEAGECIGFGSLKEYWNDEGNHMDKTRPEVAEARRKYAAVLRRERRA